jgi:hypothetical protein
MIDQCSQEITQSIKTTLIEAVITNSNLYLPIAQTYKKEKKIDN